jgi:hypothetical protein
MLKRIRSIAIANERFGMRGTNINKIFEGMCVNTIVLIRPILEATHAAVRAERPARILAPKKMLPSIAGCTLKRT